MNNNEWISVKDRLPELEIDVLIYWQLKKSNEDGFYDMIEIAMLKSITQRKESIYTEWVNGDYETKSPTHWMPLPKPPSNE